MAIPSRQIGWGTEENLLWQISKQLEYLTGVTYKSLSELAPTYKVYTALLTQSGVNDPISAGGGDLTIGVTYQIVDNGGNGWDFTNVGAPNNDIGTWFVATGTTPNSWGIDGQLDYNNGAPVVTVLENTIGNIWWTYVNVGVYNANSDGLFIPNKTDLQICQNSANGAGGNGNFIFYQGYQNNDDVIVFTTIDVDLVNQTSPSADNALSNTPIEIRVYN